MKNYETRTDDESDYRYYILTHNEDGTTDHVMRETIEGVNHWLEDKNIKIPNYSFRCTSRSEGCAMLEFDSVVVLKAKILKLQAKKVVTRYQVKD